MRYQNATVKMLEEGLQKVVHNNLEKTTYIDGEGNEKIKEIEILKGIFIYGNTGVGKTFALHGIANSTRSGAVGNWVELLFEMKDSFTREGALSRLVNDITSSKAIFIDDIGAEKQTDWSQEMLYLILNKAYENCTPIFVSTNLNIEQFTEKYGARIISRLAEMCEFYQMSGDDKRLQ